MPRMAFDLGVEECSANGTKGKDKSKEGKLRGNGRQSEAGADYFLNSKAYCLSNCKPTIIFNEKGDLDSLL